MVEVVEITRDELNKLTFPHSDAFITVFVPYNLIHSVQNNLYTQLEGAETIVEKTVEAGNEWSISVVKGLKAIIKVFRAQKATIDERGISLYYEPSLNKVYLVRNSPYLEDVDKTVLCDDRFLFEIP